MNAAKSQKDTVSRSDTSAEWYGRELDWDLDSDKLRALFDSTWAGHPITESDYFRWHLLDNYCGKPVTFCADPADKRQISAGVYMVLPARVIAGGKILEFSISMYTMTHPEFYRKGIFKALANMTYEKCRSMNIRGTVGVPNNNSLPGFSKGLKFDVIGQFSMLAKLASPLSYLSTDESIATIKKITSRSDLDEIDLSFVRKKSSSGVNLFERNAESLAWRFLQCPKYDYRIFIPVADDGKALGLMVLRTARWKRIPITVVMDFLVDDSSTVRDKVVRMMIRKMNRFALSHGAPILFSMMNIYSLEGKLLLKQGFRRIPKRFLPHECNFIIRFHDFPDEETKNQLIRFENWYFTFADFDIY